jgi:DNA (cytosine-5)-methyltransferase 1
MNHVDLFSGIGGFTLAAHANGIETVQFVEIDKRCRDFLSKAWPGVPIHDDIKTFKWNGGPIFLLTGGVPCQPASRAGKQRGKADDRWLWDHAVRVLSEVRPTWAIFENPPGIGDVGLAGILSEVEGQGYEVRVFSIPACAVGAPHRRERYWIICRRMENSYLRGGAEKYELCDPNLSSGSSTGQLADTKTGRTRRFCESGEQNRKSSSRGRCFGDSQGDMADTEQLRTGTAYGQGSDGGRSDGECDNGNGMGNDNRNGGEAFWSNSIWLPCADGKLRRAPDDTLCMAHGLPVELLEELGTEGRQTPKDCEVTRGILAALGNSIVWQVADRIIKAIMEAEDGCK